MEPLENVSSEQQVAATNQPRVCLFLFGTVKRLDTVLCAGGNDENPFKSPICYTSVQVNDSMKL